MACGQGPIRTRVCFYWPGLTSVQPRTLSTDQPPAPIGQDTLTNTPPIGHQLASAGPVSKCPESSLALTLGHILQTLLNTSSEVFIVIALACLLFDKVISMRYP